MDPYASELRSSDAFGHTTVYGVNSIWSPCASLASWPVQVVGHEACRLEVPRGIPGLEPQQGTTSMSKECLPLAEPVELVGTHESYPVLYA